MLVKPTVCAKHPSPAGNLLGWSLCVQRSDASRFSQNGELQLTHWEVSVEEHESEAELEHRRRSVSVGKAAVSFASAGTVKEENSVLGGPRGGTFPVTSSVEPFE